LSEALLDFAAARTEACILVASRQLRLFGDENSCLGKVDIGLASPQQKSILSPITRINFSLLQNFLNMLRIQSFASKGVAVGAKFMRPVPKCQFGTYKTSTGLVGLAVDPNGDETLKNLSTQVLTSVQVNLDSFMVPLRRRFLLIYFYFFCREFQQKVPIELV
jgi:hypothetical protein